MEERLGKGVEGRSGVTSLRVTVKCREEESVERRKVKGVFIRSAGQA